MFTIQAFMKRPERAGSEQDRLTFSTSSIRAEKATLPRMVSCGLAPNPKSSDRQQDDRC
jgi:hypothetical protein